MEFIKRLKKYGTELPDPFFFNCFNSIVFECGGKKQQLNNSLMPFDQDSRYSKYQVEVIQCLRRSRARVYKTDSGRSTK